MLPNWIKEFPSFRMSSPPSKGTYFVRTKQSRSIGKALTVVWKVNLILGGTKIVICYLYLTSNSAFKLPIIVVKFCANEVIFFQNTPCRLDWNKTLILQYIALSTTSECINWYPGEYRSPNSNARMQIWGFQPNHLAKQISRLRMRIERPYHDSWRDSQIVFIGFRSNLFFSRSKFVSQLVKLPKLVKRQWRSRTIRKAAVRFCDLFFSFSFFLWKILNAPNWCKS